VRIPGDTVIQIENDYDKEVYNCDRGVVSRVDMEESELAVDLDSRAVICGFVELDALGHRAEIVTAGLSRQIAAEAEARISARLATCRIVAPGGETGGERSQAQ
jgi:ATP-dependent exoDNAse (exonuclease V) alpha subunit